MPIRPANLVHSLASLVGLTAPPLPNTILVALFMPIGDILFAQPALAALRRAMPQAHITALVARPQAELVRTMPEIDAVLIYDASPEKEALGRMEATINAIGAHHYEMYLSFSTAGNALGILSGIPRQYWQRLPWLFWLWGSAFAPTFRQKHAVQHYWDVVAPLGLAPRGPEDLVPTWYVPPAERAAAHDRLQALGISDDPHHPLVILHPGAAGYHGRKKWPAERFGALANTLLRELSAQVVVLGGPTDVAEAAQIVAATRGQAISLAGQLPLRASIATIPHAACYIGCDSGLTQFAAASGIPTVALFGYSDLTTFAPRAPRPDRVQVVVPQPTPSPLGKFIGNESIFFPPRHRPDTRMAAITSAQVLHAVRLLGVGTPLSTEA